MKTIQLQILAFASLFLLFSCQNETSNKSDSTFSQFKEGTYSGSKFIEDKNYIIRFPESYSENTEKRYPVLYMMDAQNLFFDSLSYSKFAWRVDRVVDSLVKKNKMNEIIIVGLNNAGEKRFSEYMPQKPMENLPEAKRDSIRNVLKLSGVWHLED